MYPQRIHDSGARRFLIVGVAQIGCTPGKRAKNSTIHECDEEANVWCSLYNEALVKMLQQLKQELQGSLTYTYFDNYKSLHDIISNPARYGTLKYLYFCYHRMTHVPNKSGETARRRISYTRKQYRANVYLTHKNKTCCRFLISGFADVTSACCGNGKLNADLPCLPLAKLCSDRTKYLFWDRYGHPTEAAARTIVDLMLTDDSHYSSPITLTQLVST